MTLCIVYNTITLTITAKENAAGSMHGSFCHNVFALCLVACKCNTHSISHIKTRNSSGDEIANLNFFYDNIVHEFAEISQNNGHYAVQGHSIIPIESSYMTSYL